MNDEMVLVVRLRVEKSMRNVLRDNLIELFERIKDEGTFVSATMQVLVNAVPVNVKYYFTPPRAYRLGSLRSREYQSRSKAGTIAIKVIRATNDFHGALHAPTRRRLRKWGNENEEQPADKCEPIPNFIQIIHSQMTTGF